MRDECDQCGERTVAGAVFCVSCQAYLGWDLTTSVPTVADAARGSTMTAGWSAPTLVLPTTSPTPAAGTEGPSPRSARRPASGDAPLRAVLGATEVEVTPGGEPVSIDVVVHNQSEIVDAYVVDVPAAPGWLAASGTQARLMPGTSGKIRLSLRIRDGVLAVAQRAEVTVRVQSQVHARLASELTLVACVPEVSGPIVLRVEPSVIRVKDQRVGEFLLVADNSASNHPIHLQLDGQDAEKVIAVGFRTPTLNVPAGQTASVHARLEAPLPDPGEETSRQLTVSAFDGSRTALAVVTFAQRASLPVADPPLALRLHPSVVTAVDSAAGELRLEIDNSNGRHSARVQLSSYDPEGCVRCDFTTPVVDVAPAATVAVTVRLTAPQTEPGREVARPFTVVARYDTRSVEASGTFRQRTSAAPINAVRLRVEPPHVRVSDGGRGHMRVIADNRSGTLPARLWLTGQDHEGTGKITFSTPYLDAYPGQQASADAVIRARRPPAGTEHSRGFTITATDGRNEVAAEGTFAQSASDRRPLWRTLCTLFGGLTMIAGAFLPWTDDPAHRTGVQWTAAAVAGLFNRPGPKLDPTLAKIACAGTVIIVLALLAIWGRLGSKGRLTRLSALLALLLLVAFLIFLHAKVGVGAPEIGAIVILAGCVSAYIGGQLAKR